VAPWSNERLEGYRRALRDANIAMDDRFIFQAGYTIEDGEKAALQFVNESTPATAIMAVNDLVAIGCATTFLNQGMKIPGHLSLAGYGNILPSEYFRVPLTTVRQPKYRLGVAAVDSMVSLLRNGRAEIKRLPAEIIVRDSTAAPPSTL
jgi:DNA-binding LacI/PurR family transcriptional regulator